VHPVSVVAASQLTKETEPDLFPVQGPRASAESVAHLQRDSIALRSCFYLTLSGTGSGGAAGVLPQGHS